MQKTTFIPIAILMWAVSGLAGTHVRPQTSSERTWDRKAAAAYLDGRATWWSTWPNAARDHGTFCVSCHTAVPYALARPALRRALGERERPSAEAKLLESVVTRVTLWRDVAPFYPDQTRGIPKSSESRGTEAVLNALILSARDAESGRLGDDTRTAFANMWALQMRTEELSGAWAWLNFHYEPWESTDAPYFGASLAALAVGMAPGGYAESADIQNNVKLLRAYFQREYEHQPLLNRLMLLWGSTRLTGLLQPDRRESIIAAAFRKQEDDGGWSTASLGTWTRIDGSAIEVQSDGFASGLVTLVLQTAGVSPSDPRVSKGLDWLQRHQVAGTGQWRASSLNKDRDPTSDTGRFMSDAATAYAVLSLTR